MLGTGLQPRVGVAVWNKKLEKIEGSQATAFSWMNKTLFVITEGRNQNTLDGSSLCFSQVWRVTHVLDTQEDDLPTSIEEIIMRTDQA